MDKQQRIIFAGTPDFSVPCLAALLEQGYSVCAVYTQPDRPAGRGQKLTPSPVKKLALEHDIPVYQPKSLKKAEAQAELAALNADLMIVIAYGLILPQVVLDAPRLGCINVHASLLPRWRGAAPIHRALLAGDNETGITIMQMNAGLDTGDMLLTKSCAILPSDTGQILHDRLAALGAEALLESLPQLETLERVPQDDSLANYAHKLEKAEGTLDWNKSAVELERQVRAFNPWPMTNTELLGIKLRVWAAEAIAEACDAEPGSLVRGSKQGLDIATADGVLRLLSVQKAGGRQISVADFLNAQPEFARS